MFLARHVFRVHVNHRADPEGGGGRGAEDAEEKCHPETKEKSKSTQSTTRSACDINKDKKILSIAFTMLKLHGRDRSENVYDFGFVEPTVISGKVRTL